MVDVQRVRRRTAVVLGQVHEHSRVRARVPVDGLVVVPDREQLLLRSGEQPDEQHQDGSEVLCLVDEQVGRAAGHARAQHRVGEQQRDSEVHLFVEVQPAVVVQQPPVAQHQPREPWDVSACIFDERRIAQHEAHVGERSDGRTGIDGAEPCAAEHAADLGGMQHVWPACGCRGTHGQAERMHRADLGSHAGDDDVGGTSCQLLGRTGVVGEGRYELGLHTTVVHEVAQTRSEHPCLARAGRSEHPCGTVAVGHCSQLFGAQRLARWGITFLIEGRAAFDALPVDQHRAGWPAVHRPARPAVDPCGSPVGEEHVRCTAGRTRSASELSRTQGRPPHRMGCGRLTCVVEVGSEEERELVVQQPVASSEDPECPGLPLGSEQRTESRVGQRVEQDDAGSSRQPVVAQHGHRVEQCTAVLDGAAADAADRDSAPPFGRRTGQGPRHADRGAAARLVVQEDAPTEQDARSVRPEGRREVQSAGSAS